jgi:hypothetical protein
MKLFVVIFCVAAVATVKVIVNIGLGIRRNIFLERLKRLQSVNSQRKEI